MCRRTGSLIAAGLIPPRLMGSQADNRLEDGRLAGAGRAHQRTELPDTDTQIEPSQQPQALSRMPYAQVVNRQHVRRAVGAPLSYCGSWRVDDGGVKSPGNEISRRSSSSRSTVP